MRSGPTDEFATLFAQAVERQLQGRTAEALALYDAAIRVNPKAAAAHCNRGLLLQALSRTDDALASYDRAIVLQRDYADAHYNKAVALRSLNRIDEAVSSYDRAIRFKPSHAEAHANKGNALRELGRPEEALRSLDRAIALKPDLVQAHYNRGNVLQDLKRWNEAVEDYDRAIARDPRFAMAHNNRGNALRLLGRPGKALQSCDRAIELWPRSPESHNSRGNALKDLARLPEAIASYDRAIALSPDYAEAYWNKSLCALLTGDFAQGWELYEWRRKQPGAAEFPAYPQPEWSGVESLAGKTLLIRAEQGLGDTIQFCRYALLAREAGAKVVLAVQDVLTRLLAGLGPDIEIIPLTADPPAFDLHIPLMSTPRAFRTDLRSYRAEVPYLHAEPDRIVQWRDRLGTEGFKVGICWQGNSRAGIDLGRSFPLRHFEMLSKIPDVRLIGLQKHDGVEQLRDLPAGLCVENLGETFDAGPDAFIDTAAVMENLDLVITSDTAIAHLAGALGRPVWVVLQQIPDWRWLLHRADSPWYPTAGLFRQTQRGDWTGVFAEILQALQTVMRK